MASVKREPRRPPMRLPVDVPLPLPSRGADQQDTRGTSMPATPPRVSGEAASVRAPSVASVAASEVERADGRAISFNKDVMVIETARQWLNPEENTPKAGASPSAPAGKQPAASPSAAGSASQGIIGSLQHNTLLRSAMDTIEMERDNGTHRSVLDVIESVYPTQPWDNRKDRFVSVIRDFQNLVKACAVTRKSKMRQSTPEIAVGILQSSRGRGKDKWLAYALEDLLKAPDCHHTAWECVAALSGASTAARHRLEVSLPRICAKHLPFATQQARSQAEELFAVWQVRDSLPKLTLHVIREEYAKRCRENPINDAAKRGGGDALFKPGANLPPKEAPKISRSAKREQRNRKAIESMAVDPTLQRPNEHAQKVPWASSQVPPKVVQVAGLAKTPAEKAQAKQSASYMTDEKLQKALYSAKAAPRYHPDTGVLIRGGTPADRQRRLKRQATKGAAEEELFAHTFEKQRAENRQHMAMTQLTEEEAERMRQETLGAEGDDIDMEDVLASSLFALTGEVPQEVITETADIALSLLQGSPAPPQPSALSQTLSSDSLPGETLNSSLDDTQSTLGRSTPVRPAGKASLSSAVSASEVAGLLQPVHHRGVSAIPSGKAGVCDDDDDDDDDDVVFEGDTADPDITEVAPPPRQERREMRGRAAHPTPSPAAAPARAVGVSAQQSTPAATPARLGVDGQDSGDMSLLDPDSLAEFLGAPEPDHRMAEAGFGGPLADSPAAAGDPLGLGFEFADAESPAAAALPMFPSAAPLGDSEGGSLLSEAFAGTAGFAVGSSPAARPEGSPLARPGIAQPLSFEDDDEDDAGRAGLPMRLESDVLAGLGGGPLGSPPGGAAGRSQSRQSGGSHVSFSQMDALLDGEGGPMAWGTPSLPSTSVAPERAPSLMPDLDAAEGGESLFAPKGKAVKTDAHPLSLMTSAQRQKSGVETSNYTRKGGAELVEIDLDELKKKKRSGEVADSDLAKATRRRFDLNQYVESDYIGGVHKSKRRKETEVIVMDELEDDQESQRVKAEGAAIASAIRRATEMAKAESQSQEMPPPPRRGAERKRAPQAAGGSAKAQRGRAGSEVSSQASGSTAMIMDTLRSAEAPKRKRVASADVVSSQVSTMGDSFELEGVVDVVDVSSTAKSQGAPPAKRARTAQKKPAEQQQAKPAAASSQLRPRACAQCGRSYKSATGKSVICPMCRKAQK